MDSIFSRKNNISFGIFIIRAGLGLIFMAHGIPKLMEGTEKWAKLGSAMSNLGIEFYPALWGFMAAISELIGGLLLVLGLFHRVACFFLLVTMIVASLKHYHMGDEFGKLAHSMEAAVVFLGLFIAGAGKYSMDHELSYKKNRNKNTPEQSKL